MRLEEKVPYLPSDMILFHVSARYLEENRGEKKLLTQGISTLTYLEPLEGLSVYLKGGARPPKHWVSPENA
jgi:hypothetical protein